MKKRKYWYNHKSKILEAVFSDEWEGSPRMLKVEWFFKMLKVEWGMGFKNVKGGMMNEEGRLILVRC